MYSIFELQEHTCFGSLYSLDGMCCVSGRSGRTKDSVWMEQGRLHNMEHNKKRYKRKEQQEQQEREEQGTGTKLNYSGSQGRMGLYASGRVLGRLRICQQVIDMRYGT